MFVRNIQRQDIPDALALIRAKAKFDGCLDLLRSEEKEIEHAFFSESPRAKAIVADVGNEVAGIATYYDIYSTFIAKPGIWLDDLYVYERFRKFGAGKALMQRLCQIALENGCGRIDWIVARDNDNGRGFYESIGANIFEEVRHSRLDENAIRELAARA